MITLLVTPEAFAGDELWVEEAAFRHLFQARRLSAGVTLRLVDGGGQARWGEVAHVERRRARVTLAGEAPGNEPAYQLEILVAALRPERASWLVEKATELGVAAVRFLSCERTPRQYGAGNLGRLRRVAAAAVEQCHRARLPEVTGVHPWSELERLLEGTDERYFLDPGGPPAGAGDRVGSATSGAVLIGPEGGFSPAEKDHLAGRLGARPVGLGPRVLRVETAALAASVMLLLAGAWRGELPIGRSSQAINS